ncbi:hypothetical protein EIN_497100 [Entamoeba invadens IP1]|uniref:Uncharacterized protein n=1 Tax=Entamoeba invadens IP1 TaxID=370355 RepID=A0A0A1U357_ENTIV|nr:hypothetical protein EIN_497100 [Entamoeba invadens IP1]ELP87145.1 hypothetical protein EIN_497100 [Entamoeba invadens IP1]|eukprot:XP_004253916.1 hypothetical protein EIN_497100 [Entamoeba invadens IP1]
MMKKEEGQFNIWTLLLNLEETLEKIEQSNLPPEEKKVVQRLLLVPVGFYQKILRLLRCLLREGPFKENQLLMDITEQLRIFVLDAQSKNDDAENKYGIKESGGFGDDHIVLEGEPQKYPMGLTRIHVRPSVRKRYEARSLPSTPAGSPAPSPKGTPKTSPSQMRRRPLPQLPEGAVGGRPRTPSPHGDDTYEAVGGGESPYQLAGRPRSGRRRSRSTSPKRSDTYQLAGRPSPKEEGVDPYSLVGQPGTRPGTPPLETVYTLQGQPKPVDTTKEEQPVPPPRAQSLPSPPVSRPPTPPPPDYDTSTTTVQQRPKSPTTEKD